MPEEGKLSSSELLPLLGQINSSPVKLIATVPKSQQLVCIILKNIGKALFHNWLACAHAVISTSSFYLDNNKGKRRPFQSSAFFDLDPKHICSHCHNHISYPTTISGISISLILWSRLLKQPHETIRIVLNSTVKYQLHSRTRSYEPQVEIPSQPWRIFKPDTIPQPNLFHGATVRIK